jgi:hypothetical protein
MRAHLTHNLERIAKRFQESAALGSTDVVGWLIERVSFWGSPSITLEFIEANDLTEGDGTG